MATVKMIARSMLDVHAMIQGIEEQSVPYSFTEVLDPVASAFEAAQARLSKELAPFLEKHAPGEAGIGPGHKSYPAFLQDADDALMQEIEIEVEPIPEAKLRAAATTMERRAARGVGEPLMVPRAHLTVLRSLGILVGEPAKKPAAKKRAPSKKRRTQTK